MPCLPGGDVINLYRLNMHYIPYSLVWFIPVDDLYEIYKELYGDIRLSRFVIQQCTTLMLLMR